MANDSLMFGAGGLVIGAILGMMSSGPNFDGLEKRLGEKIETSGAASTQTDAQLTALTEKLAALEAAVAASAAQGETVTGQIDGAVSALNTTIASSGAAQSEALKGAIIAQGDLIQDALAGQTEALSTEIGALGDGVAAIQNTMSSHHGGTSAAAPADDAAESGSSEEAAATTETETDASAPAAATAPPPPPEPEGTAAGETRLFLDGAARVFVSSVDEDTQTARVAVNGLKTEVLGTYQAVTFEADGKICELILDNVAAGHVEMSPSCPD